MGIEWLIEAEGCQPELLCELPRLQALCAQVIAELDLHVVGQPLWHPFPEPGGVTGLYLLAESHLACHTYPEYALSTFNLYCCRPRRRWGWEQQLCSWLGAQQVRVRSYERGSVPTFASPAESHAEGAGV